MRKLCVAVFIFVCAIIFTAVWFSPLTALGTPSAYRNNAAVTELAGLCYPAGGSVRVDMRGDEADMYSALEKISAKEVKRVTQDGAYIIYAYSPRVCCKLQTTSDGMSYNVMAAYRAGQISIGTPILQGCY